MAGRQFKLEQILKIRQETERLQQLEFIDAKGQHEQAAELLKREQEGLSVVSTEFSEKQLAGIDAADLLLYASFGKRKSCQIKQIQAVVSELAQTVQEKREALLVASKDKKALEILKEKHKQGLRAELLRKERDFLDEIAVQGRGVYQ